MDFMTLPAAGSFRLANVTVPGCLSGASQDLVRTSLVVADGRIAAPETQVQVTVDMAGALVFPCFVDMHPHLD